MCLLPHLTRRGPSQVSRACAAAVCVEDPLCGEFALEYLPLQAAGADPDAPPLSEEDVFDRVSDFLNDPQSWTEAPCLRLLRASAPIRSGFDAAPGELTLATGAGLELRKQAAAQRDGQHALRTRAHRRALEATIQRALEAAQGPADAQPGRREREQSHREGLRHKVARPGTGTAEGHAARSLDNKYSLAEALEKPGPELLALLLRCALSTSEACGTHISLLTENPFTPVCRHLMASARFSPAEGDAQSGESAPAPERPNTAPRPNTSSSVRPSSAREGEAAAGGGLEWGLDEAVALLHLLLLSAEPLRCFQASNHPRCSIGSHSLLRARHWQAAEHVLLHSPTLPLPLVAEMKALAMQART